MACREIQSLTLAFGLLASPAWAWFEETNLLLADLTWQQLSPEARSGLQPQLSRFTPQQSFADLYLVVPNRSLGQRYAHEHARQHNWFALDQSQFQLRQHCQQNACLTGGLWQAWQDLQQLQGPAQRDALARLVYYLARLHQPLNTGFERDQGGRLLVLADGRQSKNLAWVWQQGLLDAQSGNWQVQAQSWRWQEINSDEQAMLASPLSIELLETWTHEQHQQALLIYRTSHGRNYNRSLRRELTPIWRTQIELAARRTAAVLEQAVALGLFESS